MNSKEKLDYINDTLLRHNKFSEAEQLASTILNETERNNESHVSAYSILGYTALRQNEFKKAQMYAEEALALAEEYSKENIKPSIWNLLGLILNSIGSYRSALEYYNKALASHYEHKEKFRIALIAENIGTVYSNLGDYQAALEHYNKALILHEELEEKSSSDRIAHITGFIGSVYLNLGDYSKALEFYKRSLAGHEDLGDKPSEAKVNGNIGNLYAGLGDYTKALEYYERSLAGHKEFGQKLSEAIVTGNTGIVYQKLGDYSKALEYYKRSLSLYEELGLKFGISAVMGSIGITYEKLGDYTKALEYHQRSLAGHEEIGEKSGVANSTANIGILFGNKEFEGFDPFKAEEFLLKSISLSEEIGAKQILYENLKELSELYKKLERWKESLLHFEKYIEIKDQVQSETAKKQADKLDFDNKQKEQEKLLFAERAAASERNRILDNILPLNITERLVKGETKIADTFENVSILFIDIVGFTKLSSTLPAHELIDVLDIVFTRFDSICKKHGLEKIKTIGDAYMAVCGAPISYSEHAKRTANAAIEMLEKFEIEQRFASPIYIKFRIGLHSGSVVAGIIGENKYSYDLWGDAVNTASRMESYGEEGKIHVSEEFRNSAGDGFTFIERGEMDIKGKGMMKTYFLEQRNN